MLLVLVVHLRTDFKKKKHFNWLWKTEYSGYSEMHYQSFRVGHTLIFQSKIKEALRKLSHFIPTNERKTKVLIFLLRLAILG